MDWTGKQPQWIDPMTGKIIKGKVFASQQELDLHLFDYVNWFNTIRIHGSLDYLSPYAYKHRFTLSKMSIQ